MQRFRLLFLISLFAISAQAFAQTPSVTGSVTYRERMAMPAGAVVEISIEDVSRADRPSIVVASMRIDDPRQVPIRFDLGYDPARIDPRGRYSVRAKIFGNNQLMFTSTDAALVITQGHGSTADLILRRVPPPPARAGGIGAAPVAPATGAASPASARSQAPPPNPFTGLPASFTGTLPCADCQGIKYQLNLFDDDSFFLRRTYIGKGEPVDRIGTWVMSSDRRILALHDGTGESLEYFGIRDARTLRALDRDAKEYTSPAPATLTRDPRFTPVDVRLALRGTYTYMADAGVFTECTTGQRWPVAMEADNRALEAAYAQAKHAPGAPIMVELEGQVALRAQPDRAANVPTLTVQRFGKLAPGASCAARYTSAPFTTTTWRLTHLGADAVPAPANSRSVASITFEADSTRFAGSGGCNRFAGAYDASGDALTMSAVGTMMACAAGGDIESRFMAAIKNTKRFRALGRTLELYDAAGSRLARFEAR